MFERFTERARQIIVLAQETARKYDHSFISTEHLLIGIIREEEGLGARVLKQMGFSEEMVIQTLKDRGCIYEEVPEPKVTGQIPFTPRAKKVLENALREALGLGHNYIGTEHVLLGLIRETGEDNLALHVLHDLGTDATLVRNEVIRMLSGSGGRRKPPEPPKEIEPISNEELRAATSMVQALAEKAEVINLSAQILNAQNSLHRIENKLDRILERIGDA